MSKRRISLASILPGLGLWILGYRKEALLAFVFVLGSLLVGFSIRSNFAADIALAIALIVWITQYFGAIYSFDVGKELETDAAQPPPLSLEPSPEISIPPSARRLSRGMYKSVQRVLESQEMLKRVVGNSTNFVALTDKRLILITRDFTGKPAVLHPFAIADVKSVSLKAGFLNDLLVFDLGSHGEAIAKVSRGFRRETRAIVDELTHQSSIDDAS